MGLGRSKHKPSKDEEQKQGYTHSSPRPMGKHPQDSEKPLNTKPAQGDSWKKGAGKQQWPSPKVEEKPEAEVHSGQKKAAIPQIVITRASRETLVSYSSIESEEQRTIQEQREWGPYARHRNPSTVDAYISQARE